MSEAASIGANSNLTKSEKAKLSGFISEVERLNAKQREINADRGNIFKAAKEAGFNTKAIKHVIKMRRMEKSERAEFETYVDAYMLAMGDFVSTPLGQAGLAAAQAKTN